MALSDRILRNSNPNRKVSTAQPSLVVLPQRREAAPAALMDGFRELKTTIQQRLLDTIDLAKLESLEH